MISGWSLVLTLLTSLFVGQSHGWFWPFTAATIDTPGTTYADTGAKRIAIIGAGAAGSSTAYYLEQFANKSGIAINVTVFERNSYVGGRTTTVNAHDNPLEPVEVGGSIFVEVNAILNNASRLFGLQARESDTETNEILGIWNGKTFVYTQKDSGWKYWDIAKLLWKYGLAPIRTQRLSKSIVGKFLKLYEFPFFPFRSLSDRLFDLGLTSVTSQTGEQLLTANKIGAPFTTDIIQASTRVNYGQNLASIHGVEAMVCMAIEGAMQIQGGNWQIFYSMLKASNTSTLLNTTVNAISKTNGKYKIKTSFRASTTHETLTNEEAFDTVVLAAPLQYTDLKLKKGLLQRIPDEIPYVTLHVTLFATNKTFSPLFFNLSPGSEVPTTILTTLAPDEVPEAPPKGVGSPGFFSISTLRQVINPKTLEKENLYKIFSPEKITSEFLSKLFATEVPEDLSSITADSGHAITWFYSKVWQSYPYELPRVTFEDPELAPGFYYTSGIESFISTMETSALMGMNVAQLIVNDYLQLLEEQAHGKSSAHAVLEEKPESVHVEEL
ncbi:related to prenylcysteine lyase [Rhynchosporium secalis]|uniref:Related to prenylcysteine lyase n=1 Tax=Rhynchosporium secalis TaxID=38038 RepID=A0A1E1M0C4_RHYSE|nr:related to prenylcysteine lyase [Rhynchosporium secalis]